jgi:predicted ATPase
MDSNSWNLVLAVKQQVEGLFIVLSTRPMKGRDVPFQFSQISHLHSETVVLQNLSETDTATVIAGCLQLPSVPEEMVREIYKKSQGNPFLTEEIVYALRDSGALRIDKNGQCTLSSDFQAAGKTLY